MLLLDGRCKELAEARIWIHTPYFVGDVTALCMTSPIYDRVLGNIPGAREAHEPDPNWEDPDWSTKANDPSQVPSSRGTSPRVSAVPPTKSRDLSSPSHFSTHYQQCGAKIGIVEKDAGGLAKMGKSKLSTRGSTQTLVGSAARLTNACSVKDDKTTNEVVMVRGGHRRQPEKRQSYKYGRKCFRRNAQHLKHFSHPKVPYYEAASGDENENRDEEECAEELIGVTQPTVSNIIHEVAEAIIVLGVRRRPPHTGLRPPFSGVMPRLLGVEAQPTAEAPRLTTSAW
ncbi:hypothetical protein MTO96_048414 [Rhipicephalus appendiculatus]